MFLQFHGVNQRDATRTSASGTHNDNTVIVDAGGDIVVIRGWRSIPRPRVQLGVDSDIETFASVGWRVYDHPGWMERAETRWSREVLGNRSTQSRGDGRRYCRDGRMGTGS